MLLVGDDVTGFYITGKLEKAGGKKYNNDTRGRCCCFDKIDIKQYKNEMITKYEKSGGAVVHG